VGVVDREGHQARRLVGRVAEHQALVAGALVEVEAFAFIDALGDVGRLAVDRSEYRAALVVKADVGVVVTDALHGSAGDIHVVDIGIGGNFTGNHHQAGGHQRLASHPATRVLGENGVQHRIGDLVGDLVGMAFGDGLRGKKEFTGHETLLQKTKIPSVGGVAVSGDLRSGDALAVLFRPVRS
jgi:hypothetical protein